MAPHYRNHLRLVALHGIGKGTDPHFADRAMSQLTTGLAEQGVKSSWAAAHWGPVLDKPEARLLADSKRAGSEGRLVQRLVLGTLADALQFPHYSARIFDVIDAAVARTGTGGKLVFVGHSLGCILTLRYLEARPDIADARPDVVFTGCNVPLFVPPGYVPPAGLGEPGRIVCAFDEDDGIGWPCRMWAPAATDIEVSVGGWFGWSGMSHTGYWGSKKLWTKLLPPVVRCSAL